MLRIGSQATLEYRNVDVNDQLTYPASAVTVPSAGNDSDRNTAEQRRVMRRVARTSMIGTTVEWYDFNIYGTAAALVFGRQFFPGFSPVAATLAAFATFAIGFLARPVGGIMMGHFGDRVGRKSMLITSLLMMGVATFCIGLLPNYASIGVWAPILLVVLRFVQGLGIGGEWGGAVVLAVEHAPANRRTFYGSFAQMGNPLGIIFATLVFIVLGSALTPEQLLSWGWRIPFLLSAVLIGYGFVARLRVLESPDFTELKREERVSRMPLIELVRTQPRTLFLASVASIASPALGYLLFVYLISYGKDVLKVPSVRMLWLIVAAAGVWLVLVGLAAALGDRYGRKPVFLTGLAITGLWALPFFTLLNSRSTPLMLVAYAVAAVGVAGMTGPQAALVADIFPAHIRYSGASVAYQFGSILGGALAPIIAVALLARTGTSISIGIYMVVLSAVSFIAVLALRDPAQPAARLRHGSRNVHRTQSG